MARSTDNAAPAIARSWIPASRDHSNSTITEIWLATRPNYQENCRGQVHTRLLVRERRTDYDTATLWGRLFIVAFVMSWLIAGGL